MIQDIKELEKLLKLCRKQGVTELKFGTVEFKLGELPADKNQTLVQEEIQTDNPYANFPDGELTPEQLAFYSSGGKPEDDPYLKEQ